MSPESDVAAMMAATVSGTSAARPERTGARRERACIGREQVIGRSGAWVSIVARRGTVIEGGGWKAPFVGDGAVMAPAVSWEPVVCIDGAGRKTPGM
jgi:hypothetical protein